MAPTIDRPNILKICLLALGKLDSTEFIFLNEFKLNIIKDCLTIVFGVDTEDKLEYEHLRYKMFKVYVLHYDLVAKRVYLQKPDLQAPDGILPISCLEVQNLDKIEKLLL